MFIYGLIFGVIGTLVCVTAESKRQIPYKPVCGTDGKTYTHIDVLNKQKTEAFNFETHEGGCSNKERSRRSTAACSTEIREVCGTDGVTYMNTCVLNQAYTSDHNVTLSHFGSCMNNTVEVLTIETNDIKDINETANNTIPMDASAQNLKKTSDVDGVHKTNDEREGYVQKVEDVSEVQNLKLTIKNQANENVTVVDTQNNLNLTDTLDLVNEQSESKPLNKVFVNIVQKKSDTQSAQIKINSEETISNVQNSSDVNNIDQSTSDVKNGNISDSSRNLNQKQNQTNDEYEGYTKDGKNKSRKRRNVQNPAVANRNEEQKQSKIKQEKYRKSKKSRPDATLIVQNTETESETEITGKARNEISRKLRNAQNVDTNGNITNKNYETKQGKSISKNDKNESKKSLKHDNVEIKFELVQGKSKEVKNKSEKSRKRRDVKNKAGVNSNKVEIDNVQSENVGGMSESDHVKLSRDVGTKTKKRTQIKFEGPRDKIINADVRKTRDLKKPYLSKKQLKHMRSEEEVTFNNKREMKCGGDNKKNGSKGACRAA